VHFTVLVLILAMTAALRIQPNRSAQDIAAADARAILLISSSWEQENKAIGDVAQEDIRRFLAHASNQQSWPLGNAIYSAEFPVPNPPFRAPFYLERNWVFVEGQDKELLASEGFPTAKTLNDFRFFWDAEREWPHGFYAVMLEQGFEKYSCRDWKLESVGKPSGDGNWMAIRYSAEFGKDGTVYIQPMLTDHASHTCTFASVKGVKADVDLGRAYSDIAPQAKNWVKGSSSQAFPQLIAAATAEHVEDTPLEKLAQIMQDRANVEPEKLQVFGAQIEVTAIPTFGGLLLVLSEIYLLAHLVELDRQAKTDKAEPVESIEWTSGYIGLYPNKVPSSFAVVSLTAFPLVPFVLSVTDKMTGYSWDGIVNSGLLTTIFLAIVVVVLGIQCARKLGAIRKSAVLPLPVTKQASQPAQQQKAKGKTQ
jgi:hypothetical protein